MEPKECLEKAQELVEVYKKLSVPLDDEFQVLFLFIRALCISWTLKTTNSSEG